MKKAFASNSLLAHSDVVVVAQKSRKCRINRSKNCKASILCCSWLLLSSAGTSPNKYGPLNAAEAFSMGASASFASTPARPTTARTPLRRAFSRLHYVSPEGVDDAAITNQSEGGDFRDFLDRKQLRQLLKGSRNPLLGDLSPVEQEYLVQSCQQVSYGPKEAIFTQGQRGDALYVVQSGQVEVVDDTTQQVLATYGPGDLFGELSLLFGEPRAATARVASQQNASSPCVGATLWKLDQKDFATVMRSNAQVPERAKEGVAKDPKYAQYLDRKRLKEAMQQCPIFKGFSAEDLDRTVATMESNTVSVPSGGAIVRKGEPGDALYFVKSGSVVCTVDKADKVVAEIGPGGYFGELAVLFNQPRAATVRAIGDNVVLWKLSAADFFEAVQDYPLAEKTLELLKDKYQEDSVWNTLQKASPEEIYDLIRNSSRPKKKNVTFHSIVSGLYAGMFIMAYLPQFHPTWHNDIGAAQLFAPLGLSDETVLQYRVCSFMVCIVSLLGQFRIAKNAPVCRQLYFTRMLWASVAMWSYGDSNIGGATSDFTFDVFTPFGAGFITFANLMTAIYVLLSVDDAIAGPMQGRETLPLLSKRWQGVAFNTFLFGLVYTQMNNLVWANFDYQGFQDIALPFYQSGFERFALVAGFTVNGAMAFGALIGTLLFEKKISPLTGGILNFVLMFATLGDQVASFLMDPNTPQYQALVPLTEWMAHYREEFHTTEIMVGIWGLVVANAFRKRFFTQGTTTSK